MAVMTVEQALEAAQAGGFYYGGGLFYIVAIGWAESRWRTDARNVNSNGSIDRGWLQINSIHDISDEDCDDPVKAAAYAYNNLSAKGTKFSPWVAYTSGAYKGPENLVWQLVSKAFFAKLNEDRAADLSTQNKALQGQLNAANSNILTLSGQLGEANDKISSLQTQVTSLQTQVASLNGQLATVQTNLSACQAANVSKDQQIAALKAKIDAAKAALA